MMRKASPEYVQTPDDHAFLLRNFGAEAFDAPYHFHPEFELTYVVQGEGKRYVGSHMERFGAGDLVLVAPNVPHCWKLDATIDTNASAQAIVIQFSPDMLGNGLATKKELTDIHNLLVHTTVGFRSGASLSHRMESTFRNLADKHGLYGFTGLLEILQQLAEDGDRVAFSADSITVLPAVADQQRMGPVLAYLVDQFRGKVSLKEAASLAHMTPHAFCKYFKKATRKTFMDAVMDYRINHATQQLVQTDKPITEIAFESGFADMSFFYRAFKRRTKLSPLHYRRQFAI
ncbi:AraC family transcriptional regulator [Parapedobacter sp. 2B3]|uniref:AraC family transcriptional regulator n=1 Tax=Parapedobacter sp. 2B3 TaxID=3342381 RepID=UPI0035B6179A